MSSAPASQKRIDQVPKPLCRLRWCRQTHKRVTCVFGDVPMLPRLRFDETVPPHPYMRCSAVCHPLSFCLPYAPATSKICFARMNPCKRCISTGLRISSHILCKNVDWDASKPSLTEMQTNIIHVYSSSWHRILEGSAAEAVACKLTNTFHNSCQIALLFGL